MLPMTVAPLGLPLQYVMYFRFCKWRHISTHMYSYAVIEYNNHNSWDSNQILLNGKDQYSWWVARDSEVCYIRLSDDLKWSLTPNHPTSTFYVTFHIFVVRQHRNSNLVYAPKPKHDETSLKGALLQHVTCFKFRGQHPYLSNSWSYKSYQI